MVYNSSLCTYEINGDAGNFCCGNPLYRSPSALHTNANRLKNATDIDLMDEKNISSSVGTIIDPLINILERSIKYAESTTQKKSKKSRKFNPDRMLSKKLTYILRHNALNLGLNIRDDGYVKLSSILALDSMKRFDFETIQHIVKTNDKQRFSLCNNIGNDNEYYIRANQGHSINIVKADKLLNEITINDVNKYPIICHGTYIKHWNSILKNGLNIMNRNHIHFVPCDTVLNENKVLSGLRKNIDILIYIDLIKCLNDGIKFYISSNNVVLSSGINGVMESKYFKIVKKWNRKDAKVFHDKIFWSP